MSLLILFRGSDSGYRPITSTAVLQHPIDYVMADEAEKPKDKFKSSNAVSGRMLKFIFGEK